MAAIGSDRIDVARLKANFGDHILKVKVDRGEVYVCVDRRSITKILEFLKSDPELDYAYFSECVGVDYSQWTHERDFSERFEVVYNIMSLKLNTRLFLKVAVNDGDTIPTSKYVYLGAEYPEREVNDLYGVVFEGNEQKDRFLLPDDWIGYPLRKEYPLGGEDVLFDQGSRGPAVEDLQRPHAGESFEGKTGSDDISGR